MLKGFSESLTENETQLLSILKSIGKRGPILSIAKGPMAVGLTLTETIGCANAATAKANYNGIIIVAQRYSSNRPLARVNLFAQVPDWDISECKSSREIVEKYGYTKGETVTQLFCTITSRQVNTQYLTLVIDREATLLREEAIINKVPKQVVAWKISKLQERLIKTHPATFWVKAKAICIKGQDYFHYYQASFTGLPNARTFPDLVEQGTITVDHLITKTGRRVIEKGPLFKIDSQNLRLLFPNTRTFDLCSD